MPPLQGTFSEAKPSGFVVHSCAGTARQTERLASPARLTSKGRHPMMEAVEVTKHYPQGRRVVRALQGVGVRIGAGEFVSIMGPSGSGKSTFMHVIATL